MIYTHLRILLLSIGILFAPVLHANEVWTKPFDFPSTLHIAALNDPDTLFTPQHNQKYLISFWASWCVPCITELKHFIAIRSALQQNRIQLVLINVDRRPKTAIAKFMDKHALTYDGFYVTDMYDAMAAFDATGLPITVAVDDSKVLFRYDYARMQWNDSLLATIVQGFEN